MAYVNHSNKPRPFARSQDLATYTTGRFYSKMLLIVNVIVTTGAVFWVTNCSSKEEPSPPIPASISPRGQELLKEIFSKEPRRRDSAQRELSRLPKDVHAAIPMIIGRLNDDDPDVRNFAMSALTSMPDSRSVEPLITRLRDPVAMNRYTAARALAAIADLKAVEPLTKLLTDSDAEVRAQTAAALGRIPDSRALKPLLALLNDSVADVRGTAAWAIGELRDVRAVEPLLAILEHDPDTSVCGSAASALGKIGDVRALEPLVAALHKNIPSNPTILRALGNLRDPRARDVLTAVVMEQAASLGDRIAAATALGKIRDGRVADSLVTVWQNDREAKELRLAAAIALGETRDYRRIEALAFALENGYGIFSRHVVSLIGEMNEPRANELLSKALKNKDPLVRLAAEVEVKKREFAKAIWDFDAADDTD